MPTRVSALPSADPPDTLQLQYVRGRGLVSSAIMLFSGGLVSHVDVVLPDGSLVGARSDRIKVGERKYDSGVQIRPPSYEPWDGRVVVELRCRRSQKAAAVNWLMHQRGKPYDHVGILAFIGNRDWRDPSAWFCSELVTAMLEHAGIIGHVFWPASKITPAASLGMVTAAGGHVTIMEGSVSFA